MEKYWPTRRKLWPLNALLLSILLANCQTIPTAVTDTTCVWDAPLTYSSRDTIETINGIVAHNAGFRSICE